MNIGLACLMMLLLFVSPLTAHGAGAGLAALVDPAVDWRAWHNEIEADAYRDFDANLARLRDDLRSAHARGDRHREWMTLSWLATQEAWTGSEDASIHLQRCEQAISEARAAGDRAALFHLILMVEWARVNYQRAQLRESLMNEAQAAAYALGDPMRQGLLEQLRGYAAAGMGLHGEALAHYRLAMATLDRPAPRAELLCLIARSLAASLTQPEALRAAEANLRDAITLLDPTIYTGFMLPYVTLTQLYIQWDRPAPAVEAAQQALSITQMASNSPVRLARMRINLAQALVAAGAAEQALDELSKVDEGLVSAQFRLDWRLARAEAASLLNHPDALQLLAQAQALVPEASGIVAESGLRFHDATARIHRHIGEVGLAMDAMAASAMDRRRLIAQNSERLFQARLNEAAQVQENAVLRLGREAAEQRRRLLLGALAVALVLMACLAGLWVKQIRQSRRLASLMTALSEANQNLNLMHESRTRLLAAACHDLRQPAHVLGMLTELAWEGATPSAGPAAPMEDIRRASALLTDMLDSLMDMAQLEGGRYEARHASIPLQGLIREIELEYGRIAQAKGLKLLLPTTRDCVQSDPHLLRRILFNLVSNSLKYTPSGTISITVETADDVRITVRDTGVGMPAERLGDIFKDYVRLDSNLSDGLGIGLSIVKRAVDLLGHSMTVDSRPGEGTTFTLVLPLAATEQDADAPRRRGNGEWVVVMDDDALVRRSTSEVLQRHGYQVVCAASSDELLSTLQSMGCRQPQVVVSDLHMQGVNGLDEIERLRSQPGWTGMAALLLTGDMDPTINARARQMGVRVAHKPMTPERLLTQVGELAFAPN